MTVLRLLTGSWSFWLQCLRCFTGVGSSFVFYTMGSLLMTSRGLSEAESAFAFSISAVTSVAGRLLAACAGHATFVKRKVRLTYCM